MAILIDGYNFLHATGILGRGIGPGGLERSRLALLNFLAESLPPADVPHTTVVFDAHESPPGLPRIVQHCGLTIHFAAKYEDADSLIEELIVRDSSPRRLTVVSSDHRLQRAAHRRRAKAIDSDLWYAQLVADRRRRQTEAEGPDRPPVPLLAEDVEYWIRQFGGESALKELFATAAGMGGPSAGTGTTPSSSASVEGAVPAEKPADIFNPFPPGYAEDLEE